MLRRTCLPLLLMATALLPVPGRAATTRDIEVVNNAFVARAVVAAAGDTIRWNVRGNEHTVVAYSGATFDSGLLNLRPGDTYTHQYGGGTILYRCRNHSTLSGPANDCAGMCGKLTDVPPEDLPPAPTVNTPAHGSTTDSNTVTFTGGVIGNAIKIRMFEGTVQLGQGVVPEGGNWVYTWPFFPNGTHDIHFIAEHPEGYYSQAGPVRTVPNPNPEQPPIVERFIRVTVAASDGQPPKILLDQPRDPYSRSPLRIQGRVTDDVAVDPVIEVIVRDMTGLTVDRRPRVVCENCGTNNATFYASASLDPGPYTVIVRAKDLTNKHVEARRDVLVLV